MMENKQNTPKDYALAVALEALAYARVTSGGKVLDAIEHAIEAIKKAFNEAEVLK